ETILQAQIIY
ncbi:unnamed protein product, partial [Oikopleura dioica]